jgi:hypothetical protein
MLPLPKIPSILHGLQGPHHAQTLSDISGERLLGGISVSWVLQLPWDTAPWLPTVPQDFFMDLSAIFY